MPLHACSTSCVVERLYGMPPVVVFRFPELIIIGTVTDHIHTSIRSSSHYSRTQPTTQGLPVYPLREIVVYTVLPLWLSRRCHLRTRSWSYVVSQRLASPRCTPSRMMSAGFPLLDIQATASRCTAEVTGSEAASDVVLSFRADERFALAPQECLCAPVRVV